jgi:hypothetical protein
MSNHNKLLNTEISFVLLTGNILRRYNTCVTGHAIQQLGIQHSIFQAVTEHSCNNGINL